MTVIPIDMNNACVTFFSAKYGIIGIKPPKRVQYAEVTGTIDVEDYLSIPVKYADPMVAAETQAREVFGLSRRSSKSIMNWTSN